MSTIFYLLLVLSFTSSVLCTEDDENVLLTIKKQLGDPDILQNWVKGFNFCDGPINSMSLGHVFIYCTRTGRVSYLLLSELNITVPFPDAVCGLTELEDLAISRMPGLYGPIPSCITKLPNLRQLYIVGTSLSGSVPSFYNHTNIGMIILRNNHLSGTIPPSLSTLPNLHTLDLSSNYLTGTIPPGLVHGLYPQLVLSNNNLTGELPKCYEWVDFMDIDLGYNLLSGDASFLFGKQKRASSISLAHNEFEFDLGHLEFSDKLQGLDLSHNKIYGKVPDSLGSIGEFFANSVGGFYYRVDLSFNKLCGELPQGGKMWKFKAEVFANNTCLCGNPLPPCSISAPGPAPVSEPSF